MNCKKCIHKDVCAFRIPAEDEKTCASFKNESDYTEVVHGRWIDCIETGTTVAGINASGLTGYNCSVCGRYEGIKELYCNCGAKMDGDDVCLKQNLLN